MKRALITAAVLAIISVPAFASDTGSTYKTPEGTAAGSVQGSEEGTIKSIDHENGKIQIEHLTPDGMKSMHYMAKPEILKGLKTGEKVKFDFSAHGKKSEISSIHTVP